MKIHGKTYSEPRVETVVIPHQGGDLVFKAKAILDYTPFETICPLPEAPMVMRRGGEQYRNLDDPKYKEKIAEWSRRRTNWMIIESLKATDGLEWETITSDPATWSNYVDELVKANLSLVEINCIVDCVIDANGLNQKKIDEATERFLAGQAQRQSE